MLTGAYELEAGRLFGQLPHDAYLHQVGVCHGFESVLGLIESIDAHAQSIDDHASKPGPESTDRTALAFWGGPWFKPSRNASR